MFSAGKSCTKQHSFLRPPALLPPTTCTGTLPAHAQPALPASSLPLLPAGLQDELKSAQKQIADLKSQVALASSSVLADQAVTTDKGAKVLVSELPGVDPKSLQVRLGIWHTEHIDTCPAVCCMLDLWASWCRASAKPVACAVYAVSVRLRFSMALSSCLLCLHHWRLWRHRMHVHQQTATCRRCLPAGGCSKAAGAAGRPCCRVPALCARGGQSQHGGCLQPSRGQAGPAGGHGLQHDSICVEALSKQAARPHACDPALPMQVLEHGPCLMPLPDWREHAGA